MRRELGLRAARRKASALLHEWGVRAPHHIQVEAFAGALGVGLVEGGLDSARARLRYGAQPLVRISDHVTHPGARRFSLAHELGHLVLRHPPAWVEATCADAGRKRSNPDVRDVEAEADAFAAEVLMPGFLVQRRCEVSPLDLAVARSIESDFRVSFIAGALRVAELTSERCAVVFSERGMVRWARSSRSLPWDVPRGKRLDRGSVAADYFRKGALDERPQPVEVGVWFDRDREADLVEHSIAIPELGAVVSLLWIPERAAEALGILDDMTTGDRLEPTWMRNA